MRYAYAMPVCALLVSSRSGIVFNPRSGAITDHSQSVKDIDLHFKSQLYAKDHAQFSDSFDSLHNIVPTQFSRTLFRKCQIMMLMEIQDGVWQ